MFSSFLNGPMILKNTYKESILFLGAYEDGLLSSIVYFKHYQETLVVQWLVYVMVQYM